jgi:hypothetical protein
MTKLLSTLLVMTILVVPVSAANVSGVWGMTLKTDFTTIPELICTLSQNGQSLTGTCRAAAEPNGKTVDLTGGKVDGTKVSCQWNVVTPDGERWTYALTGTLDAKETTMEGTFTLSSASSQAKGRFSAKKQ